MSSVGKPYVKGERVVKIRVIEAGFQGSGIPCGPQQAPCPRRKAVYDEGFSASSVVGFRAVPPL
jgi:hypothetical protein